MKNLKSRTKNVSFFLVGFLLIIGILFNEANAQIGIGTNTPNANALLDLQSNNKGLLIPRITKSNRPANPPAGLMIYQTDNVPGFYFFTGAKWQRMYAVDDTMPAVINPSPGATNDPPATAGATGTVTGADGIVYKTVRLGDGSVWLQQNLGSSRVATALDDAQSFGDLYQWGRWTDGHEKRIPVFSKTISPTEPNPNNPAGLVKQWGTNLNPFYYGSVGPTWWDTKANNKMDSVFASLPSEVTVNNGCDPCKLLLGGSWRLPTLAELSGLLNNAAQTGVGIYSRESAFSSYLKFPISGFRDYKSTTILNAGFGSRFWASTVPSNSTSTINSDYLEIGQQYLNGSSTNYSVRGYGYSIRCKKD